MKEGDPATGVLNIWTADRELNLLKAANNQTSGPLVAFHCAAQQLQFAYAEWQDKIPLPPNPSDCIPLDHESRLCSRCIALAQSEEGLGDRFNDYFMVNGDVRFKCAMEDDEYKNEKWRQASISYWSFEREGIPCVTTSAKGRLCGECLMASTAQNEKYNNQIRSYLSQETDDAWRGIEHSPARAARKTIEKALKGKQSSIDRYFDKDNRVRPEMMNENLSYRNNVQMIRTGETFTAGF